MKQNLLTITVVALCLFLLLPLSNVFASRFIVTNTNDSGPGSLRSALTDANANAGPDTVLFNIPVSDANYADGVWVIRPQTVLPNLESGSTFIDGTSQTANRGDLNVLGPEIVISGQNISGFPSNGFYVSSTGNKIKGLVINNFASYGIRITGPSAQQNVIEGNYIGVNATGTGYASNGYSGVAMESGATGNIIGGDTEESRNVISGNSNFGVSLSGSGVTENVIKGNYIGTAADGTSPLGNGGYGVNLENGATKNTIGPDNVIAHNIRNGVYVTGSATLNNTITGNSIHSNALTGIETESGGNGQIAPPTFLRHDGNTVYYSTLANAKVEIFSDREDEGAHFEGSVTAGSDGAAVWTGTPLEDNVTATTTDLSGNTSEFSLPQRIIPYTVVTTADTGAGSLRWAIEGANTNFGPDSILFAIPKTDENFGGGIWRIRPDSALPALADNNTIIDGRSQARLIQDTNAVGPEIFLDGSSLISAASGLTVTSARNVIQGLGIVNFSENGLSLSGSGARSNLLAGNFIGVGANGTVAGANNGCGILLKGVGSNNVIGGEVEADRNIISANRKHGIQIEGADSTVVKGNYIGCDVTGTTKLGNTGSGIYISGASTNTTIGGAAANQANVLAANTEHGILLNGSSVKSNKILGNFIGTNQSKITDLANEKYGVYFSGGASENTLGPNNTIMFNKKHGVSVSGSTTLKNRITQNSISKNVLTGIEHVSGGNANMPAPSDVLVAGNKVTGNASPNAVVEIFSDNAEEGAHYEATVTATALGTFTWQGTPQGPGVTATATDDQGNTSEFSLPFHTIPFIVTTTLDSVEGSLRWAIDGSNLTPEPDVIEFNIPKSDPNYDAADGVWHILPRKVLPILTGGHTEIDGSSQTANQGDTNANGPEILIDGAQAGNVHGLQVKSANNWLHDFAIGRFVQNSIVLTGVEARDNKVTGCYVGLAPNGTEALSTEGWNGIVVTAGASSNVIGGATLKERNYVSGNKLHGINIVGVDCRENVVIGNYVGTDITGMLSVGNKTDGIHLEKGAVRTRVGGLTPQERNLCSGNGRTGIRLEGVGADSNLIVGNWVGLTADGADSLFNGEAGIVLGNQVAYNTVGGLEKGAGNLVSGNHSSGIQIRGTTEHNLVLGNTVGLDATGTKLLGNAHHGIYAFGGAANNEIGPGNVICGNGLWGDNWCGIMISDMLSHDNKIFGNYVGIKPDGTPMGNMNHGIGMQNGATKNTIGPNNVIAHNGGNGVWLSGARTQYNVITKNSIFSNAGKGIEEIQGANLELPPPVVTIDLDLWVTGQALQYSVIEVFGGSDHQGKTFLATTNADANGQFKVQVSTTDSLVTATATDILGNTSEFSPGITTAVEKRETPTLPTKFALEQNYPNPFNPSTTISFDLPKAEHVTLEVFNIQGQRVARVVDRDLTAGRYDVSWQAMDDTGHSLPSGAYMYVLKAGSFTAKRKLMVLK